MECCLRSRYHLTISLLGSLLLFLICVLVEGAKINKLPKVRCTKDKYGNNNCTCPDEPITERYADTGDVHCEFYFLCHLGIAVKMQCAPYWAFHPNLQECLPRARIPTNICKPLVNCPVRPNRYIEDPNDCTKFYLCYYGRHLHWRCPDGSYFQPDKEKCIRDKGQTEACVIMARKNYYAKLGQAEKPPPITSVALTQAKALLQEKKSKNKERQHVMKKSN